MGTAKPALGFRSRTEAIIHFRKEGRSREWIARQLGIEVKAVSALECSGRRIREPRRDFARPSAGTYPLDIREMLQPHAAMREISLDALIRRVVEIVAVDDLVDAILDDARQIGGAR